MAAYDNNVLGVVAKRFSPSMANRAALLTFATLTLAACDFAGTAFDDTARLAAVEQCRQVSQGAGIAGPAVTRVCDCAADKWLDKPLAERAQIDRASIESIINECAGTDRNTGTGTGTNTDTDTSQATESY